MPTPPSLEVRRQGDQAVVCFAGLDRLDEYNSDNVGKELSQLVEGLERPRVALDLRNIHYVTSTALGKLIGLNKKVRSGGGRLGPFTPAPAVAEVLAVTCLDKVFEISPPAGEASESLSA